MAQTLQFHCTINNRCSVPLKVKETQHSGGTWYPEEFSIPKNVPAKQVFQSFSSSGRKGSVLGTEGYIIYQLGDEADAWIKIYWDITWAPTIPNKVQVEESHDDIVVSMEGFIGLGLIENVTFKVFDGRG